MNSIATPDRKDGNELAAIVREMIKHENELINHRITWLVELQGLLFAALGFSWDKRDAHLLIYCFCLLGSLIAVSSFIALASGDEAISQILWWWDVHKPSEYSGPDVIGVTAGPLGNRKPLVVKLFSMKFKMERLLYPWFFLPGLFIAAWLAVAICNCIR